MFPFDSEAEEDTLEDLSETQKLEKLRRREEKRKLQEEMDKGRREMCLQLERESLMRKNEGTR